MKKVKEQIVTVGILSIDPSPENSEIYNAINDDDPDIIEKAESLKKYGFLELIVISKDRYIIAGHRRHRAAYVAGFDKIPVKEVDIVRGDGKHASQEYVDLLIAYNKTQRIKTNAEVLREILATKDTAHGYERMVAQRKRRRKTNIVPMEIYEGTPPRDIGERRRPFLEAVQCIIEKVKDEGAKDMTARHIHYRVAFSVDPPPPLTDASNPDSRYQNTGNCSGRLSKLLTDARYADEIDFKDIVDLTRQTTLWPVHANVQSYLDEFDKNMLLDYPHDLMQSQSAHIEIIYEKTTLTSTVEDVAFDYGIPITPSRGQDTTRPLFDVWERYKKSGKARLILIIMSDLDPDGDAIANSIAYRLRDLHGIKNIEAYRAALTMEQVRKLKLPVSFERAKKASNNYERFVEKYGTDEVFELDAVSPQSLLAKMLRDTIESVIDLKAFNAEKAEANKSQAFLEGLRDFLRQALKQARVTS